VALLLLNSLLLLYLAVMLSLRPREGAKGRLWFFLIHKNKPRTSAGEPYYEQDVDVASIKVNETKIIFSRAASRPHSVPVFAIVLLSLTALSVHSASAATASLPLPRITSYRVDGAPNYSIPGNESFWKTISWTRAPLVASVKPGGGHTPNLLIKSANDGFNIYVLFRWNDSQGASYASNTELYTLSNGTNVPLYPENTTFVNRLYYTPSYYYQDRAAMLWFIGDPLARNQTAQMKLGTDGALNGGAAEIWHWQSNPTDNSANDTGYPGGYVDPANNTVSPPNRLSFAEDDYTNTTGFWVVPSGFPGAPNLVPYADPFEIHVGNYFSNANKTWTVEMVRSFTTTDATQYRVQLATGAPFYTAFAVWNGRMGESSHIKSVSQWYNFTITDQPPPAATPAQTGGISVILAGAVGGGLLIIGVILGLVVRPGRKEQKR
jgi:ethylbenzene dehydrogenase